MLRTLDLPLAGVPDRLRKWLTGILGNSAGDSATWPVTDEAVEEAIKAEAETGGVADLELRELSPQLFSSMTRAGDFNSILGRVELYFLWV